MISNAWWRCAYFILFGCSVLAQTGYADDERPRSYYLEIESLPLLAAVKALSDTTGVEVLFFSEIAEGVTSSPVQGRYTSDEALAAMLAGTDLEVVNLDKEGAVAIRLIEEAQQSGKALPASGPVLMAQDRTSARQVRSGEATRETNDSGDQDSGLPLEEVVVLGTRIRGARSTSPVYTFSREEIDNSGVSTMNQFIRHIPQNFGGGSVEGSRGISTGDATSIRNFNSGTGVNLRGLGTASTLVLLDGYRMSSASVGQFVDISLIPLSAIERVDVLPDGASAIYGSDAVGGVVNFVLRDEYDGAETRVRYGTVTNGDSDEIQFGQTLGNDWGSGHALVSYEFHRRNNLDSADRDFSIDAFDPTDLLPQQERQSVFASAGQEIGKSVDLFATSFFAKRDTESFESGIFGFGAPLRNVGETKQHQSTIGAAFRLGRDWRAEVAGTYGESTTSTVVTLADSGDFFDDNENESSSWIADFKADGEVFELPGGAAKIAIGGQYRKESYATPSFTPEIDQDRSIHSVFVEVLLPFVGEANRRAGVERLELSVAGRYEDYSDFGTSTSPKLGLTWSPSSSVSIRGSYGKSFQAPLLFQIAPSSISGFLIYLPDPAAPSGETLAIVALGNNPGLGAETAETWSVGFDAEPTSLPGLRFGLTYFDIDYEDRIASPGATFTAFTDPTFEPLISRDPSPELIESIPFSVFVDTTGGVDPGDAEAFVDSRLLNFASTSTRGLDFAGSYQFSTDSGDWSFSINSTYLIEKLEQLFRSDVPVDVVDTVNNPVGLKVRAGAAWRHHGGFSTNLFLNHTGDYRDNRTDPSLGVDSWTTVDVQFGYETGTNRRSGLLEDLQLSLSIRNLFDADPPFVLGNFGSEIHFDPDNASALGRFVALQINKPW